MIKQIEGQKFLIFATESMQKLKITCTDRDNSIDYRHTDNTLTEFEIKTRDCIIFFSLNNVPKIYDLTT